MDQNDKQAIEGLFGKLAQVERQSPQRDAQAEAFISSVISRQPSAPYYMAQTIVVQEHALNSAQERIAQLESDVAAAQQNAGGGGFLSNLFGGGRPAAPAPQQRRAPQPYQQQPQQGYAPQQQGGGGFLAGAAQTAMGVAGGVLLGNAIMGLFGGDEAQAAEHPAEPVAPEEEEARPDEGFEDDGGGDFGGDE